LLAKLVDAYRGMEWRVIVVGGVPRKAENFEWVKQVSDVPVNKLDRVVLCLPSQEALAVLDKIAAKGCGILCVYPVSVSDRLLERARALGMDPVFETESSLMSRSGTALARGRSPNMIGD
jgi:hypothetical protein